jgi:N-acetylglucosamine-6-sulfatase
MSDNRTGPDGAPGMTRREFLHAGAGTLAWLMSAGVPGMASAAGAVRPNIVFILSDDHRWDHLGCAGHPFVRTPALDSLAADGVLFENAFVVTSLCSPSRACFLTGQYPHTHGVRNNITPWRDRNVTFLEILKRTGYDTAFIGKWHMPGSGLPKLRGVDRFVSFTAERGQGSYYNCPLYVDGEWRSSRRPYITSELTDHAIEFIATRRERPFCLYLAHKAVHHQWLAPKKFRGMYDHVRDLGLPEQADPWIGLVDNNITYGMLGRLDDLYRRYCETITAMDAEIGRLLTAIDALGLREDTLVVYAGDNGYLWGEHHRVDKRWAYEESIRIPFIARCPRLVTGQGRRAGEMVLNVDLAPTLTTLAGSPAAAGMEGMNFAPLLARGSHAWRSSWLYEHFRDYPYSVPDIHAVRTATHKYVETGGRCGGRELYDVVNDPGERRNLLGTDAGERLAAGLKRELDRLRAQAGTGRH